MLESHPELWDGWMDKHETPKMRRFREIYGVNPLLVGPDMPFWDGIRDGCFREALFILWFVRDTVALPWSSEPRKPFECKPPVGEIAPWTRDTVNTIVDIVKPVEVGAIYLVSLNAECASSHIPTGCRTAPAASLSVKPSVATRNVIRTAFT